MIIYIIFIKRTEDFYLSAIYMKLSYVINFHAKLAWAFSPFFYFYVEYVSHNPTSQRFYNDESIILNSDPGIELFKIFNKNIAPKKMSIKSSTSW